MENLTQLEQKSEFPDGKNQDFLRSQDNLLVEKENTIFQYFVVCHIFIYMSSFISNQCTLQSTDPLTTVIEKNGAKTIENNIFSTLIQHLLIFLAILKNK